MEVMIINIDLKTQRLNPLSWNSKIVFTLRHSGQNGMRTSLGGVATAKKGLRKVACCAKRSIVAKFNIAKSHSFLSSLDNKR